MSVILTSALEWTKFGDDGGDEAPCRAASGLMRCTRTQSSLHASDS